MILYPAIDLKGGAVVRLHKGAMDAATEYSRDPAAQAAQFARDGFSHLHVVDLDGAFAGDSANKKAVQHILAATSMPIQLGGGIRSEDAAKAWLDAGIARVILGTAAVKNPALVRQLAQQFPQQIVVGIDAKAGMVAVEGWAEVSELRALDLAKKFEDAGVTSIIYTDIARDGTLSGPNLEETAELAAAISIPVILSGGISNAADIARVKQVGSIAGIIIGKALYEKRVSAAEALKAAA